MTNNNNNTQRDLKKEGEIIAIYDPTGPYSNETVLKRQQYIDACKYVSPILIAMSGYIKGESIEESIYKYARDELEGPWELGERIIVTHNNTEYTEEVCADLLYRYARDCVKGPFILGETIIAKYPEIAYNYVRDCDKGTFPEAERAIAADPVLSKLYTIQVITHEIRKNHHLTKQELYNVIKQAIESNISKYQGVGTGPR